MYRHETWKNLLHNVHTCSELQTDQFDTLTDDVVTSVLAPNVLIIVHTKELFAKKAKPSSPLDLMSVAPSVSSYQRTIRSIKVALQVYIYFIDYFMHMYV